MLGQSSTKWRRAAPPLTSTDFDKLTEVTAVPQIGQTAPRSLVSVIMRHVTRIIRRARRDRPGQSARYLVFMR